MLSPTPEETDSQKIRGFLLRLHAFREWQVDSSPGSSNAGAQHFTCHRPACGVHEIEGLLAPLILDVILLCSAGHVLVLKLWLVIIGSPWQPQKAQYPVID